MRKITLIFFLLYVYQSNANTFCFNEAGDKYHIDPLILQAIAIKESGLNPVAIGINKSKTGEIISRDYGLMQINDVHVRKLQSLGIIMSPQDLLSNSCLNIQAGAWILILHLQQCGVTWECLGSYNAGHTIKNRNLRLEYARDIFKIHTTLKKSTNSHS